jgi:lysozyme
LKDKTKHIVLAATIVALLFIATPSNAALENLVKQLEEDGNAKLKAYNDGYGNWTIGFGSTYNFDLNRPIRSGDTITIDQAYRFMRIEIEDVLSDIKGFIRVPVTQNQLFALASLGYNIGTGALENSTLIKQLNAGYAKSEVAKRFLDFVNARNKTTGKLEFSAGLYKRRLMERDLFLS